MKFFVVILTVIGIESIGNDLRQVMADDGYKYEIYVTRDQIKQSPIPNDYIDILETQLWNKPGTIKYLQDITGDELQFYLTLTIFDEVVYSIPYEKRVSICDDRPLAQLVRGTMLPWISNNTCPITKGDYYLTDLQVLQFTNPVQLTCGEYTGTADVLSKNGPILEIEFNYDLDPSNDNCKEA